MSPGTPRDRTLNSGRLAQPYFWHFVGQRALEHLLGWEREGYANCTLVATEAAKKGGGSKMQIILRWTVLKEKKS